ncbi:MAG TPA: 16S rRNA (cytosine(967)-C(5))-methyltransferase [Trichocoleus sp.]|jgi:16S rRNA (cytosine967-C5)-methyltransferase
MTVSSRQLAFLALRSIAAGAYADIALDRVLQEELSQVDRRFLTELVYGSVRRQRTLDTLIDQLAKKPAHQQPPDLRLILHLGLYQLRYLTQVPVSAAVDTTVELAKQNGLKGLAGFVNGLLRQYVRLEQQGTENRQQEEAIQQGGISSRQGLIRREQHPLPVLPTDPIARLGIQYSYPDWIVQLWQEEFGLAETEKLCKWFNQPPHIDLRINPLKTSIAQVEAAMLDAGIQVTRLPNLPQGLRLPSAVGAIQRLPGFEAGWWTVQDSSAQLVSHLLDPQPGETVIDACAAPGGKTTHQAELMQDQGIIWACDRYASRLKKLQQNAKRLQLRSIQICSGDSRDQTQFVNQADRLLLDAPCSGLGTLHRHADARWRQTPETVKELAPLQAELLNATAAWVKPGGCLVYATCTLNSVENEAIVTAFLEKHLNWQIDRPSHNHPAAAFVMPQGWLKVLPHQHNMDGFFMVRLQRVD